MRFPDTRSAWTGEEIPDLSEPLQEPKSNLSPLISLASILLSSPPLPLAFIHPSASHLGTLSPRGMPGHWDQERVVLVGGEGAPWGSKVGLSLSQQRRVLHTHSKSLH